MNSFISKWKLYLSIIFSPDVVISVLGAIVFGYWSIKANDELTRAVGTAGMAILTGVAGGFISKGIIEEARKGQIFTRGQSAVRGLGLILVNLFTLEGLLEKAKAECNDTQQTKDFIYINSFAVAIQRQAVNSMEEWKDILPEADIRRMIDDFSNKVSDANELRESLESVQKQLDDARNDVDIKGDQLKDLEQQKSQLEKELKEKEMEARSSLRSSLPINISGSSNLKIVEGESGGIGGIFLGENRKL